MALRRLVVAVVAVGALALVACTPVPAPSSEHQECVAGAEAAKAHRPDLITTGYTCANYGDTGWVGFFGLNGQNWVSINEAYTWYTPSSPAGGYYCVAAHEWGHAWDYNQLGWSHGGSGDPEAYARLFAAVYFGC